MVTGGSAGIGKEVFEYFKPNSKGISRTNNYDIREPEVRSEIAKMSLEYDIFFNHAYSRDSSQTELFKEVYKLWREKNKRGYIFSTGTYGTYSSNGIDPEYVKLKSDLDLAHKEFAQQIKFEKLNFRITLLRLGLLDTERSRQKPQWPGYGLKGKDVADFILYLYRLPQDVFVPDVVLESKSCGDSK